MRAERVEVVVLERGGSEPLARFRIHEGVPVVEADWRQVGARMKRPSMSVSPPRVEFFFCYLGLEGVRYDEVLLRELTEAADRVAAGARLQVVVDRRIRQAWDVTTQLDSLRSWFQAALDAELDDVLEDNLEPVNPVLLRWSIGRSHSRQEIWERLGRADAWRATLSHRSSTLAPFLLPYLLHSSAPDPVGHLLVVDEVHPEEREQLNFVEDQLVRRSCETVVVAALSAPKHLLMELCTSRGIGLLWLRGPFELRYLLMRLNQAQEGQQSVSARLAAGGTGSW